ncbi:hypothetical protein [Pantoea sp. SOD02]|uniref:hypothetical protein n=1 Tax=Pantoea sp. SOD02 TaxID=2970818 RepID=UPI0021570F63|nr:hypothetical protein [Pantoea sp. SOD02]UVC29136.1 hypothetical protein NR302_18210 [Pantoea sp. SOD02]
MRKLLPGLAVFVAFILPWALVLLVRPSVPVPEWCEVPYRIDNQGKPTGTLNATVRTRFKADGSGTSTIIGTVSLQDRQYRLNRVSVSTWHRQGDFMLVNTRRVQAMTDDTVPEALAIQILFTSARAAHNDYYQMYQLPNGDQIINYSGMPRLYCHT